MAEGVAEGVATGIGEGLNTIASQIRYNQQQQNLARDKQADDLTVQIKSIADNIAKVGGKDAPEAAPLIEQLNKAVQAHNELFPPHESGALIQRIQKMMGHKPGAPQQDVRAQMTPAGAMATSPAPSNPILQEVTNLSQVYAKGDPNITMDQARQMAMKEIAKKYHTADTFKPATGESGKPFKGPDGKTYQLQIDDQGNTRKVELPEGVSAEEGWKPLDGEAGKPFKDPADNKIYQMQVNKEGKTRRVPLEGMTDTAIGHKPLEAKTNTISGGLDSISDPNSGKVYSKSDIESGAAPPEVTKLWKDISGQIEVEQKRKADLEAKKEKEAEERQMKTITAAFDRQEKSFKNTLAEKDYGEARKQIVKADEDYQAGIDRMTTMDKNLIDAQKGDQQAMLSLVANHIGMTLGAQKGARITRAAFDEAVQSAPWLAKTAAKWSDEGYLSGVTLTPEQMQQMVRLAREKVDVLKDHKRRVEDEYHEALNPRPNAPAAGTNAGSATGAGAKKPTNADEYLQMIGHGTPATKVK